MAKYSEQEVRTLIGWFPSLAKDPNFKITSDCPQHIIALVGL